MRPFHLMIKSTITLADVADFAGVGASTASRVLRNQGAVSERTRENVMAAARALNYMPNRIAGTLASMRSKLVGIVVPSIGNAVTSEVLTGALSVLEHRGFQAIVGATNFDPEQEEKLVQSFLSWRPQGIILSGIDRPPSVKRLLQQAGTRVVEILDIDGQGIDLVVGFSNKLVGRKSAEYLLSRNYRRFGYVGYESTLDLGAGKRLQGFQSALKERSLSLAVYSTSECASSSVEAGRQGLARLLAKAHGLEAVYFSNDYLAIGGYCHCLEVGISVPGDLALFGYGGLPLTDAIPKALSTVRSPRRSIGNRSVELVLGAKVKTKVSDLGFELVKGETC